MFEAFRQQAVARTQCQLPHLGIGVFPPRFILNQTDRVGVLIMSVVEEVNGSHVPCLQFRVASLYRPLVEGSFVKVQNSRIA